MQFQKSEIKDIILSTARKEFLENGFEKASIRTITTTAKVSKSNLYNYFDNKDALFVAVVAPTLSEIRDGFEKMQTRNAEAHTNTYSITAQKKVMKNIAAFMFEHEVDLKLLLFRSSGSSLSGFKEQVINALTNLLTDWISHVAPNKAVSNFFVGSVARFYVGVMEQMLTENVMEEQMEKHFDEVSNFVYGGWKTVLQ